MKLNCLIVDDDPFMITFLTKYVEQTDFLQLHKACHNPFEAVAILENEKIDLLFLDVEMPELTGLDILKSLRNPPCTIMVTSNRDYAVEAIQLNVMGYLVKPFDYASFYKAAQKVLVFLEEKKYSPEDKNSFGDEIFLKVDSKLVKLRFDEILYVEACANYVIVHTALRQHIVLSTMKSIESKLPAFFTRIHRSFIINNHKIDYIEDSVVVINQKHLTISNSYKTTLLQKLNLL